MVHPTSGIAARIWMTGKAAMQALEFQRPHGGLFRFWSFSMDFQGQVATNDETEGPGGDSRPRLIVIGNGMAGCRAVEELLERDSNRYRVTIFGAEPHVNYNRIMLSPVLAGEKTFEQIVINDHAWYADTASSSSPVILSSPSIAPPRRSPPARAAPRVTTNC